MVGCGSCGFILALAGLAYAIWLGPREDAARVAWSYRPPAQKSALYLIYPRPQGGCFAVNRAGTLYVMDAAGKVLKQHSLHQGERFLNGVVDAQGNLYVGASGQGAVSAYSAAGQELWRCTVPDHCSVQPPPSKRASATALGADGKLYVAFNTGEFAVLSRQGVIERRFDAGVLLALTDPPAIAPDGGFYLVAWRKDIIHISATGKVLWRVPTSGHSINQLQSGPDGTAYFVAHQDKFYAYNPDGTKRWEYVNPGPLPACGFHWYDFTQGVDGTVYISSDERLSAFKPDGTLLWSFNFNGGCGGVFVTNAKVYVPVAHTTVQSQVSSWVFWTNLRYNTKLPVTPGGTAMQLYILDKSSGQTLDRMALPDDILLSCGPCPQGEFYGYRVTITQPRMNLDFELLRINIDR
jgi:outer membrane protein assembly factor BamB